MGYGEGMKIKMKIKMSFAGDRRWEMGDRDEIKIKMK